MNKKGFTLVELLAVIVLLGLVALIAAPAITGIIKQSKDSLSDSQNKAIEMSAKNWGTDNMDKLPSSGKCILVSLTRLQKDGYADLEIKDPKTGNIITHTASRPFWIKITKDGKRLIYEVEPQSVSACGNRYE